MAFQRKKPAAIGVKGSFPGFVEPALATSIEKVPSGDRWIHEVKFDGYRVQVHLVNEAVKVFTRRGNDWTKRFRKVADDAWHISAGSAIIDGEIVVPAADGTTDFSVLQNELKGRSTKIVLVAFDLLYLNGYDLRKLPLIERKAHLKKLIEKTEIQFSESFEIDGKEMFAHACKIGLEGVVSKVRDSRYLSGRGRDWVKTTCAQRETLTIAGTRHFRDGGDSRCCGKRNRFDRRTACVIGSDLRRGEGRRGGTRHSDRLSRAPAVAGKQVQDRGGQLGRRARHCAVHAADGRRDGLDGPIRSAAGDSGVGAIPAQAS